VGLRDLSFLIDHVRDAARVLVIVGITGAVGEADLVLGVAEQREGEVVFLGEAFVGGLIVEAGSEDLGVFRFVLRLEVPEPGTLARSTGGVGLRVKPEDDFAPAKIAETDAIAVVIDDIKVGCFLSRLQHGRFPSCQCSNDSANGHAGILCSEIKFARDTGCD
jgi:hypothetical protein